MGAIDGLGFLAILGIYSGLVVIGWTIWANRD